MLNAEIKKKNCDDNFAFIVLNRKLFKDFYCLEIIIIKKG